jgi:hypothetical protein
MKVNPEAKKARDSLDPTELLALHLYALTAAVRAILAIHSDPPRVRAVFDQLIAQMQAHPAYMASPAKTIVLRDFVATLFQPPVNLDTDPQ